MNQSPLHYKIETVWVYGTSEITGVKGVKTSGDCNMSKLTKKFDPCSADYIRKANKPNKKGGRAVPMEG
jgi:hypothetical protein